MTDRPSATKTVPGRTDRSTEAMIEQFRIAAKLGLATSTVRAVLARLGLNRMSRLEPPEPPNRYCRRRPSELIHIDIKSWAGSTDPAYLPMRMWSGNERELRPPRSR